MEMECQVTAWAEDWHPTGFSNPPEAVTRLLDGRHHLERFAMEQAGEVDYLITWRDNELVGRVSLTPCRRPIPTYLRDIILVRLMTWGCAVLAQGHASAMQTRVAEERTYEFRRPADTGPVVVPQRRHQP